MRKSHRLHDLPGSYLSSCQQHSGNVGNKLTLPSACFMMLVLKKAIEKSWREGVGTVIAFSGLSPLYLRE